MSLKWGQEKWVMNEYSFREKVMLWRRKLIKAPREKKKKKRTKFLIAFIH